MPLSTGKIALKVALENLVANTDPDKTTTIDEFVDALEDFIKSASIKAQGTGMTAGPYPVSGVAALDSIIT